MTQNILLEYPNNKRQQESINVYIVKNPY